MPAQTIIKLRRGTAAAWTSANPVLSAGEVGLETDTYKTKYGDGTTAWTSLPYSVATSSGGASVDWNDVLNKPTEFTPEAHAATHEFGGADAITIEPSQVTGLDSFISDVQTTLPNKSDVGHTHVIADITDYAPPGLENHFMLMGA